MQLTEYQKKIIDYYFQTENAYKDSWDLEKSLSIHYGYRDATVNSFSQSLLKMNEVMMEAAAITSKDKVLDAGCGVGGSSIFLASLLGCHVTGITLSQRQVEQADLNAEKRKLKHLAEFKLMDYSATTFSDESFDVVWCCESVCYAEDKNKFVAEAFRLLKPGGRMVIADGFVSYFANNNHPVIQKWLKGWQVNYLETMQRMQDFMSHSGFTVLSSRDISKEVSSSSKRLLRYYYLASLYLVWQKIKNSNTVTPVKEKNIRACKYQYIGLKKKLWQYGLIVAKKPVSVLNIKGTGEN
jgi:cyclopropane fatty-acyl-phospholipid synthase-like methyltransferase